jgi:hypothetical protein
MTPHPAPSESIYSSEYTDISSVVFSPPGPPSEPTTHTPVVPTRSSWTPLLVYNADGGTGGVSRNAKGRETRGRYVGLSTPLESEEHHRSGVRQSPSQTSVIVHPGWRCGSAVVCCPETSRDSSHSSLVPYMICTRATMRDLRKTIWIV